MTEISQHFLHITEQSDNENQYVILFFINDNRINTLESVHYSIIKLSLVAALQQNKLRCIN